MKKTRFSHHRAKKPSSSSSSINLTLTPDLTYPNNSFSQFFSLLPDEIFLNEGLYQTAITEFHYPVDYKFVGFFRIHVPDYLDLESKVDELDLEQILRNIKQYQNDFENCFLNFSTLYQIEKDKAFFRIDENVTNFEQEFASYFSFVKFFSHFDSNLNFNKTMTEFFSFLDKNFQFHLNSDYSLFEVKNFFTKIFNSFNEIKNKLSKFTKSKLQIISIKIEVKDGLSKNDLIDVFVQKLQKFGNFQDKIFLMKPFVQAIDIDSLLRNLVTISNNQILFNKRYPFLCIKNFKIYTDIISNSFVLNNKSEPILRIVSTKGKNGDFISHIFDRPHFEPINKTRLYKIFIKITDENDNLIDFQTGSIIIKLQVKKI